MFLTLCLHTSTPTARVFLLRDKDVLVDDVATAANGDPTIGPTLAEMTMGRLAVAAAVPTDITRIMVDIGPGRLSAVRAAVSFANAFAFGLNLPILPVLSTAICGQNVEQKTKLPTIVVHKAAAGNAYVGRIEEGVLQRLRYGPLTATLETAVKDLPAFALIGLAPSLVNLPEQRVVDGGAAEISAAMFRAMLIRQGASSFIEGPVQPITEQSEMLHGE
jgi:tRNA threonylcarbamoyladenosine biosynthesis protein TsaB